HRGAVLEMRWPSRPRLQRRPRTDGPAILHQLGGAEIEGQIGLSRVRRHSRLRAAALVARGFNLGHCRGAALPIGEAKKAACTPSSTRLRRSSRNLQLERLAAWNMLCWTGGAAAFPAAACFTEVAMSLGLILIILVIIYLLGGFSGRFGGYGYGMGHSGMGL